MLTWYSNNSTGTCTVLYCTVLLEVVGTVHRYVILFGCNFAHHPLVTPLCSSWKGPSAAENHGSRSAALPLLLVVGLWTNRIPVVYSQYPIRFTFY